MKADLIEKREVHLPPPAAPSPAPTGRLRGLALRFPSASQGLLSIADQAIVSGTGFATAAIVGRMTSPDQLGLYYVTLTIVLIVIGIQDQVVAAPYLVYSKRRHGLDHAEYAGSVWLHHLLLSAAVVAGLLITIGVLTAIGATSIVPGLWALAVVGPLLLLREDIRRFAFADLHLGAAMTVDAAVAVLQIGGLLALGYYGQLTLFGIFGVMGGACALACLGWLLIAPPKVRFTRPRFWTDWHHNWAFSKWALRSYMLGATTPYVMVWIVNAAIGPVAAGVLGACTTLVGITRVLQAGVTNILTTQSSHAFATGGYQELRRVLWRSALFLGLSLGGVCFLLLFAGDFLAVLVFGEFYGGTRPILVALGLSALFAALSVVAGNGLWAIEKAPSNFVADIWATAVTLALAAVLVMPLGALGAALATLAGSIVATVLRVFVLVRAFRSARLQSETAVAR